jgi:hypothetical protein
MFSPLPIRTLLIGNAHHDVLDKGIRVGGRESVGAAV